MSIVEMCIRDRSVIGALALIFLIILHRKHRVYFRKKTGKLLNVVFQIMFFGVILAAVSYTHLDVYKRQQKSRRMELLRYQIGELEDAQIRIGEQEELFQKKAVYTNSKHIATSVSAAKEILDGGEEGPGIVSALSSAADALSDAQRYFPALRPLAERLRNASYDLEDCSGELRGITAQLEYDPEDQERVEERLDTLYRLGMKYGEKMCIRDRPSSFASSSISESGRKVRIFKHLITSASAILRQY